MPQLIPERLIAAGGIMSGKPRASECWTAGNDDAADDWSRMYQYIPKETPLTEVALQFDIYVAENEPWSNCGHIQINLFNNFNFAGIGSDDDGSSNQVAFYVPYIQDGEIVPFYTEGWQTVTIPFSEFNKYATINSCKETPTFEDVVTDRNSARLPELRLSDLLIQILLTRMLLWNPTPLQPTSILIIGA